MEYTNLGKAATETWEKMKANKIGNWTSGISAMIGLVAKLTAEVGKQAGWTFPATLNQLRKEEKSCQS